LLAMKAELQTFDCLAVAANMCAAKVLISSQNGGPFSPASSPPPPQLPRT